MACSPFDPPLAYPLVVEKDHLPEVHSNHVIEVVMDLVRAEQNSNDYENFEFVVHLVLVQESIANCCNVHLVLDMFQDVLEVPDQRIFGRRVVDNYHVLFLEMVDDCDEDQNSVDFVGTVEDSCFVDTEEENY